MTNKKISPLGTPVRAKSVLNRDLCVGDLVLMLGEGSAYGNSGFAMIAGQTPKNIRVIEISNQRITGQETLRGVIDDCYSDGSYGLGLHGGEFYIPEDLVNHPVRAYLHEKIKELT